METLHIVEAGMIGPPQIILIAVLLIILFGAKRIPELMKGVGKGIKEFKDASKEEADDKKEESKK
jgi:sec-independent protein translocase protein TatA